MDNNKKLVMDVLTFLDISRMIETEKGRCIKLILLRLERDNLLTPEIRKTVLDGVNDYARKLHTNFGSYIEN